jgi:hypothetical protein
MGSKGVSVVISKNLPNNYFYLIPISLRKSSLSVSLSNAFVDMNAFTIDQYLHTARFKC